MIIKRLRLAMTILMCSVGAITPLVCAYAAVAQTSEATIIKTSHPLKGIEYRVFVMKYDPLLTQSPIVYFRINGGEAKPFIFDTGYTGRVLITEEEAKRLNLKVTENARPITDGNGVRMKSRVAKIKSLEGKSIEDFYVELQGVDEVTVVKTPINDEKLFPTPAVGVIGLGLFQNKTLYFTFERQEIDIYEGDLPDISAVNGSIALPLIIEDGSYKVDATGLWGTKEIMLVDTGAQHSALSKKLIEKLKPTDSFQRSSITGAGISDTALNIYSFDTILLRRYDAKSLFFEEARNNESILGMDILNRFRVSLDPRRKQMVLEPTLTYLKRDKEPMGYAGIEVARQGDGNIFVVRALDKYKEWIGGQVVGIDEEACRGKTIKELPLAQVQSILDGYAGTEVKITVRKLGVDKVVAIKRMTMTEMKAALKEYKG